jgi:glycosyltransferase involved in cell wall biosynthesis
MARRILLLITDLEIGGTPTVVRELATRLHDPANGVHVEVACLSKWGPVADQIRATGVTVTPLNASGARDLLVIQRLIRLVLSHGIDTVFSFLIHANAVAASAKPFCRGARFLQSIQTTQPGPRWHWKLQGVVQHAAEKVVVPSQSVAESARQWSDVPTEKVVVIPNAVDPDLFPRSPVPEQNPRPYPVGFIGRLDPIKRLDLLMLDVAVLEAAVPGLVHLHVYGDGPQREEVLRHIRHHGIGQAVTMHGRVDRPQDALKQIGLLVLKSDAEGFGLVLIEAMASGVPVIGTKVPGIRDVVRDGATGLLVHRASPGEMLMAVQSIVNDGTLRDRLIRNGLAETRDRFSWDRVLHSYRQLLCIG